MPDLFPVLSRLLEHYRHLTLPDYVLVIVLAVILSAIVHKLYAIGFRVSGHAINIYAELQRSLLQDRERLFARTEKLESARRKAVSELDTLRPAHAETKANAEILAHNVRILSIVQVALFAYTVNMEYLLNIALILNNYIAMDVERRFKDAPRSVALHKELVNYSLNKANIEHFGYFIVDAMPKMPSSRIEAPKDLLKPTMPSEVQQRISSLYKSMNAYIDRFLEEVAKAPRTQERNDTPKS